jgi:hypothetical protein
MIFKELLQSCSFDDLLPTLLELMSDHKDSMPDFKIVFDKLRHTEPISTSVKIRITNKEYISVDCFDRAFCCPWDESLGMEVVLADNLQLSTPEIVAHCIWEMTFYGFSESNIHHFFAHDLYDMSEEGRKVAELKLKALRFQYPKSAKSDSNNKERVLLNPDNFGIDSDEADIWETSPRKMNRSKRKRLYRWEKRIVYLERRSRIKSAIQRLTANSDINEGELNYLFKTKLISEREFESCSDQIDERAQYLVELFTKYAFDDLTDYTKFWFLFQSSTQHPITEDEKSELAKIKEKLPQNAEIRFGYGSNDDLGEKMTVLRLMSKDKNGCK